MYMLTLTKNPALKYFSEVYNAAPIGQKPEARLSMNHNGQIIRSELRLWRERHPMIHVLNHTVMPDHIHLLVHVTERIPEHLGYYVADFMRACTAAFQFLPWNPQVSFFEEGYNDRIVYRTGQKDIFFNYIKENAYRLLVRRLYPDYFRKNLILDLGDEQFEIYGNLFLLEHPVKGLGVVSSRFSEEKKASVLSARNEALRTEGVIVSPFISQDEKDIRDAAVASGCKIILLVLNGMGERYSPKGEYRQLCEEGRCLVVAPLQHSNRKVQCKRWKCLELNRIAERITALQPKDYTIRKKPK